MHFKPKVLLIDVFHSAFVFFHLPTPMKPIISQLAADLFESLKTVHTFVPMAIEAKDAFVTARVKFPVTLNLVISH